MDRRLIAAAAITACLAGASPGFAGVQDSGSAPAAASRLSPAEAAAFSKEIETDLAAKGARIAIVFRTGRPHDKLPPGISDTHGAFWVYRTINTEDGRALPGYAVYNLFSGDGKTLPVTRSCLAQDWPYTFAQGSAVDDVAVIIPSPEMQRRIIAVIATSGRTSSPAWSRPGQSNV